MDPQGANINILGESTKEPAFGLLAKWTNEGSKEEELCNNCTCRPHLLLSLLTLQNL